MTLVVTKDAAHQILESARHSGQQGVALRVAAKRTHDGGIEYAMGFDDVQGDDAHIHWHGVDVLVGPTSTELLSGATLDYVELEEGKYEFIFINPNDPHHVPPEKS